MFKSLPKASVDYSLLGGAESLYPPTPAPETPSLSAGTSSESEPELESLDSDVSTAEDGHVQLGCVSQLRQRGMQEQKQKQKRKQVKVVKDDERDFLWMMTEEPHRSRRKAILKAHPEVRKLMGYTRLTFPVVLVVLTIQLATAIYLRNTHPLSLKFLLIAYAVGGTLNQNTFLSIHEITHNLAFKRILPNKLLAMVSNIAIGVPYAMAFKGYHIEHHKFLGEDGIDTDLPSKIEAIILNNVAGKTFFATFQIFFYALRPGFIRAQKPTVYHLMNVLLILFTDYLLVSNFGWYSLFYLLLSSFFAGSLHPCAAHFIAEHYLLKDLTENTPDGQEADEKIVGVRELAQETTSYYGWLNVLCYNVGYHNEHHDFPSVPWTRLPELHRIAREFYDPLPSHPSWPAVTWQFITDSRVGMFSRAKREMGAKGERIEEHTWTVSKPAACNDMDAVGAKAKVVYVSKPELKVVDGGEDDKLLEQLMEEAVERGYE